jgi:hypothetical protein
MGLDSTGKPDPTSYYAKMKSELGVAAGNLGIDTSFTDSMSDGLGSMTTASNEMAETAKAASKSQIASLKTQTKASIPKTPTPPTFF